MVNGVRRIATTLRVNRSIATVSSSRTHRPVRRSIANTSRTVVSSSRYSPGRVAFRDPYVPVGLFAIDRLPLLDSPPNRPIGRPITFIASYALVRPGTSAFP